MESIEAYQALMAYSIAERNYMDMMANALPRIWDTKLDYEMHLTLDWDDDDNFNG